MRWNDHLRAYFETSITQFLSSWFLLQVMFLCDAGFVIQIYEIMTTTTNAENLQQYKSRFALIVVQVCTQNKIYLFL